jgi:hypothetical protein
MSCATSDTALLMQASLSAVLYNHVKIPYRGLLPVNEEIGGKEDENRSANREGSFQSEPKTRQNKRQVEQGAIYGMVIRPFGQSEVMQEIAPTRHLWARWLSRLCEPQWFYRA